MDNLFTEAFQNAIIQLQGMLAAAIAYSPRLVFGIIVALLSWLIARWVRRWAGRAAARIEAPEAIAQLFVNASYVAALLVGLTLTLSVWGINVYGLVAGLGVGGLVIGFALKDIIENWLAGTLLLLLRPFVPDDVIEVGGVTGTVIEVKTQTTTICTLDNLKVVIPNREVHGKTITNYTFYPVRRREIGVGLSYGLNPADALRTLLETLRTVEGVEDDPEPFATLDEFGDSAMQVTFYYYINIREYSLFDVQSAAIAALQEAAARHEIEMPYPTQVVINR